MDKIEAFNVISQVCQSYKGDLKEHNLIQNALRTLTPEPVKPKVDIKNSTVKNSNIVVDSKSK